MKYLFLLKNIFDGRCSQYKKIISLIYFCRLNKIGKNPNLVSHHEEEEEEEMGSESKTINAVVNALSEQAEHANTSVETVANRSLISELGRSLHMLTASLPRPKSENNFTNIQDLQMNTRLTFHKSDIVKKEDTTPTANKPKFNPNKQ